MVVGHARRRIGEIGQLVIVSREERLRSNFRVGREEFCDRPRNRETVERSGAASDLVEDHEAARRGRVQDVGGLLHLDHER